MFPTKWQTRSPKKRRKVHEDTILKLPSEDKIVVNRVQENDIYMRLQEYLKNHDAKLYHYDHFEGENILGEELHGSKEIYHLEGATVGVIPYKTKNEEKPRITVAVSGDDEIKKEIKNLFNQ